MKALLCLVLLIGAHEPPQLTKENFDHWRDFIQPSKKELAHLKIEWGVSLRGAVLSAQRSNKPIMLWAMNCRPLRGCT